MVHLQKVNFHIDNVYNLDLDFLVSLQKKVILLDLDNTLDAYNILVPASRTHELIENMTSKGLIPLVFSNNKEKRVKPFCDHLRVKYLASSKKPFKKKILDFLKNMGIQSEDVIIIGDQLLTDAKLARKIGATMILTEPLSKKEYWTTRFNRLIDKPLRKRYVKNNMLGRQATKKKGA